MALIQRKIENKYHKDLTVMTSDDNEDFPVIRIKITEDEADKGGGTEEDDEDDFSDNDFLKLLSQDMMNKLELQGIKDVKKVALREQKRTSHTRADDDGVEYDWAGTGFETRNEWMLDTEGNNLQKVLQHEHVDFSRTTCNHVLDVFEVLGIEAARNSLLSELKGVIEFDGSYVNARHISILVELMCSRGHLMAITRHGINRQETGALMRASFEETVDILLDAACKVMCRCCDTSQCRMRVFEYDLDARCRGTTASNQARRSWSSRWRLAMAAAWCRWPSPWLRFAVSHAGSSLSVMVDRRGPTSPIFAW